MTDLPIAQILHRKAATDTDPVCRLDYAARFLRRKRLTSEDGRAFIVDLAQTTSLDDGDVLELSDGSRVAIRAAEEAVLEIRGENLPRLAWHIGNRHTPCQIEADHLKIQNDPVIAHMLDHLEARITETTAPFTPEGGAYGHGRTHSHEHGATAHSHSHAHAHAHSHSHSHEH